LSQKTFFCQNRPLSQVESAASQLARRTTLQPEFFQHRQLNNQEVVFGSIYTGRSQRTYRICAIWVADWVVKIGAIRVRPIVSCKCFCILWVDDADRFPSVRPGPPHQWDDLGRRGFLAGQGLRPLLHDRAAKLDQLAALVGRNDAAVRTGKQQRRRAQTHT
jgi:hypothetical protein